MSPQRLAILLLALAVPVAAQDAYDVAGRRYESHAPNARVRYAEPSVTLERSSGDSAEEAQPNVPFLPGDRLSTDGSGRAELQLESGVVVRLDSRSSLEFLSEGDQPTLQLSSGGLYVHARQGFDLTVETPGGRATFQERGIYRVDVASGETRLTVIEGSASLDSAGRTVDLQDGERTYAREGAQPEDPQPFDRGDDEFALWDQERESRMAYAGGGASRRYLPREVEPYADDLDSYGSWSSQGDEGYVWRPRVDVGWSPYTDGRWIWTAYGWTWCPYESWGWAPFHYGRWGFRASFGWYWIPGGVWGPAWVSWAHGGDYFGWCPLGFRDRPVVVVGTSAWNYARRADILAPRIGQRRVRLGSDQVSAMTVLSSPRVQPSRDFRTVHAIPEGRARVRALGGPLPTPRVRATERSLERVLSQPQRWTNQRELGHPTDRRQLGGPAPIVRDRGSNERAGRAFVPEQRRERPRTFDRTYTPSVRTYPPSVRTYPPSAERGREIGTRRELPQTRERDRSREWTRPVERQQMRPGNDLTREWHNARPRQGTEEARRPRVDRSVPSIERRSSEMRQAPAQREARPAPHPPERRRGQQRERDR